MSESSEVVGGGASVAAAAPKVSAAPVEERGGGTLLEDAPRETEGSATWTGSLAGNQLDQGTTESYG